MMVSKRNLLFQGLLFRFHVKFQGGYPPGNHEFLPVVGSTETIEGGQLEIAILSW